MYCPNPYDPITEETVKGIRAALADLSIFEKDTLKFYRRAKGDQLHRERCKGLGKGAPKVEELNILETAERSFHTCRMRGWRWRMRTAHFRLVLILGTAENLVQEAERTGKAKDLVAAQEALKSQEVATAIEELNETLGNGWLLERTRRLYAVSKNQQPVTPQEKLRRYLVEELAMPLRSVQICELDPQTPRVTFLQRSWDRWQRSIWSGGTLEEARQEVQKGTKSGDLTKVINLWEKTLQEACLIPQEDIYVAVSTYLASSEEDLFLLWGDYPNAHKKLRSGGKTLLRLPEIVAAQAMNTNSYTAKWLGPAGNDPVEVLETMVQLWADGDIDPQTALQGAQAILGV